MQKVPSIALLRRDARCATRLAVTVRLLAVTARLLAVGALCSLASTAQAGGLPERAPSLTSGHFALTFDAFSSHSCSRSYASNHDQGTLRLTLQRQRIRLELDMTRLHTFGDARSRYLPRRGARAQGRRAPRAPTHRRERWRHSWQGRPRRSAAGDEVRVLLKRVKSHCQVLPLSGTAGAVKIPCRTRAGAPALTLRCRSGLAQTYGPTPKAGVPSYPGKNEVTRQVGALLCRIVVGSTGTPAKSSDEPLWLASLRTKPSSGQPAQIVLAPAPGLQLFAYKRSRGFASRTVLRRPVTTPTQRDAGM